MDIVSNLSTAIDIAKKLRALDRKVSEADFKMLLADLTNELGDAKLEAGNLKNDLAEATSRIRELEDAAARKDVEEPEIDEGAYVFGDKTRHYCTGCYDTKGRKVLLTEQTAAFKVFGKWACPACKQTAGAGY